MIKTFASICTGGGIYEQGLTGLDIQPIWGVEIDPKIAAVYRRNYPDSAILVEDVCKVDWAVLDRPDYLHASPSCRNYSIASPKSESPKDIDVAEAIARAIKIFKPEIFTLENVEDYKYSEAWKLIYKHLIFLGYQVSFSMQKMNLWGVPQKKRDRFIVVATLNQPAVILKPPNLTKYWFNSIKDLAPTLKPHQLTFTQKRYLPYKAKFAIAKGETVLLKRNQIRKYTPCAYASEPNCWTITATLCTDQSQNNRNKFADLVTSEGIYRLSTRCLARLQTIPDSYTLSGSCGVDGLIIGNGVPSFFVSQLWQQIGVKKSDYKLYPSEITRIKN